MLDQSFQSTTATEFRMRPGSFPEMRKQIVKTMGITFGVLVLILLALAITFEASASTWVILAILPLIFGFSTWNAVKKQETMFYSYRLSVTPENIVREQQNMPPIFIPRAEITRILKSEAGAYSIIGRNRLNAIIVFAQVERPAELEPLLASFTPIQVKKNSWLQFLILPIVLLVFALAYGTIVLDSIWLSGLTLALFTGFMGWSIFVISTSRNIEKCIKLTGWLALIPILALISVWLSRWELW